MILNTMQLLLAEKRTALSGLRTGIAIFAFPLLMLSVLIATSRLYEAGRVLRRLPPLLVPTPGLVVLAICFVTRSIRRLWHYDRVIREYKRSHAILSFPAE